MPLKSLKATAADRQLFLLIATKAALQMCGVNQSFVDFFFFFFEKMKQKNEYSAYQAEKKKKKTFAFSFYSKNRPQINKNQHRYIEPPREIFTVPYSYYKSNVTNHLIISCPQ